MTKKVDERFADKIGAEYELFPLAEPHYSDFQKKVGEIVGRSKNANIIVELGCGTGMTTKEVASNLSEATVIGVDVEEVMLEQARQNVPSKNVKFVRADAIEYLKTVETETVDVVASAFTFHNMPPEYRREVFEEIGRVLKRDGLLVICDKIAQDDILEYWRAFKKQVDAFSVFQKTDHPELTAEWTEHYLADDRIRLTEKEQKELFNCAGCPPVLHKRILLDAIFSGKKGWQFERPPQ
jgi:ubiquinone/menaquinone biosynthesis C-methylase UbiE